MNFGPQWSPGTQRCQQFPKGYLHVVLPLLPIGRCFQAGKPLASFVEMLKCNLVDPIKRGVGCVYLLDPTYIMGFPVGENVEVFLYSIRCHCGCDNYMYDQPPTVGTTKRWVSLDHFLGVILLRFLFQFTFPINQACTIFLDRMRAY